MNQFNEPESKILTKSELPQDRFTDTRTIYDAKWIEIFGRQFLAGFARGLGGMFVYLTFIVILFFVASRFLLPRIQPLIDTLETSISVLEKQSDNMEKVQDIRQSIPEGLDVNSLLQQFQQGQQQAPQSN